MILDGCSLPLDRLPASFAGLPVRASGEQAVATPSSYRRVGVALRVSEADMALSEEEYTARVLRHAETCLSNLINGAYRSKFVGVTFEGGPHDIRIDAWMGS